MGLFRKLFKKKEKKPPKKTPKDYPQTVFIHFDYGMGDLSPLFQLEDELEEVISNQQVGIYDGHEIAIDGADGILFIYGENAETLFKTIQPTLEKTSFLQGAKAVLRFGKDEEAPEIALKINVQIEE